MINSSHISHVTADKNNVKRLHERNYDIPFYRKGDVDSSRSIRFTSSQPRSVWDFFFVVVEKVACIVMSQLQSVSQVPQSFSKSNRNTTLTLGFRSD